MVFSRDRFAYSRFLAFRKLSAALEKLTGIRVKPRIIAGRDVLSISEGSKVIEAHLVAGDPFFAGRIGTSELAPLYEAMEMEFGLRQHFSRSTIQALNVNAGFFPPSQDAVRRFVELMSESLHNVDLLGLLGHPKFLIEHKNIFTDFADLRSLEPYYEQVNWGRALEGKHILVIHPLAELISSQFTKRSELFEREGVIPDFRLSTLAAVQSIANSPVSYSTWFDALDDMTIAMSAIPFDVALIGAGAYGFPLAARAKSLGKQAIHMGGALQILFGIKGRRWDKHPTISRLYNSHWVRPPRKDVPTGAALVEQGCYW